MAYPAWWIDRHGVGLANREALRRALASLESRAGCGLADGNLALGPEVECLPRADARSAAVAAASVVAKVLRDDAMRALSETHTGYGFGRNRGLRHARAPARALRTGSLPGPPSQLRRGRRLKDKSPGAWGEDLALRYLIQHGYTLLERNYRTRRGEIDLIVFKDDILVLVPRNKAIP